MRKRECPECKAMKYIGKYCYRCGVNNGGNMRLTFGDRPLDTYLATLVGKRIASGFRLLSNDEVMDIEWEEQI